MVSNNHALAAFDRGIAKLEIAHSLRELEGAFEDTTSAYPFLGASFSWWSHPPPAREPDFRLSTGQMAIEGAGAVEVAGDLWADSRPVIKTEIIDGEDPVDVQVALLGPRRRFGVLRASLCVGRDEIDAAEYDWKGRFLLLAHIVQQSVDRWRPDKPRPILGRREVQCLKLAAEGLKAKQIAIALGIGQQTVQFHLSRAREKLNCGNTVQAVARAAQFGLLPDLAPAHNFEI